jgi:hypothetical protein
MQPDRLFMRFSFVWKSNHHSQTNKNKSMKNLLIAILLFAGTRLSAQKSTSFKTMGSSGYGTLSTQFSRFNGQTAIFQGVYGGWMINHRFMIGIGGYGLVTHHTGYGLNEHTQTKNDWKMGYGGLMAEYTFPGSGNWHFTANTLIGGGIIKNGFGRGTIPENGHDELSDVDASGFYVIQPGVNIEYSVTCWFRIGGGLGYRYIMGSNQTGITDAKMSARTASISFKFGAF